MLRCDQTAGRYRISLHVANVKVPYHAQIVGHKDVLTSDGKLAEAAPVAMTEQPWEGELCIHELDWLGGLAGRDYHASYEFTVEKLP